VPDALPQTRYTPVGECDLAYQVFGRDEPDLVVIPNSISHLELSWESPPIARVFRGLASFSRVILFDQRGCGLSGSPARPVACLEDWMEDTTAVMDAAGSSRAALLGLEAGGPMALLLAATRPDRVSALILVNTYARVAWAPDYAFGVPKEALDDLALPAIQQHWGDGYTYAYANPQISGDPVQRAFYARMERYSMTPPEAAQAWRAAFAVDVREILGSVQAPTLVLHASRNPAYVVEHARYLTAHLPNARLLEYEDDSHAGILFEHADLLIDETETFLTGEHHVPDPQRVLATVLFTDIVGSTEQAAELGDRRWRRLLEAHDELVIKSVQRFGGRFVKSTGDGALATFDGPARAVRCAESVLDNARGLGVEVRSGLHTGEVELRGDDLGGVGVHVAARVAAQAGPGELFVSSTVKDLVAGSGIDFEDRGERQLKGIPGQWRLYGVVRETRGR
jgi:class 3 adenylate cyclase